MNTANSRTLLDYCETELRSLTALHELVMLQAIDGPGYSRVVYGNGRASLEVDWEQRERTVEMIVRSAASGEEINLSWLIAARAPELMPPERPPQMAGADIGAALRLYARAAQAIAGDVLAGDFGTTSEAMELARVPWVLECLAGPCSIIFARELEVGDLFAVKPAGFPFVYGRVIRNDMRVGDIGGLFLVYVYKAFSERMRHLPALDRELLLIPPFLTGRLDPIYFRRIARQRLTLDALRSRHCFRDSAGILHDGRGQIITAAETECGVYGALTSADINRLILEALTSHGS